NQQRTLKLATARRRATRHCQANGESCHYYFNGPSRANLEVSVVMKRFAVVFLCLLISEAIVFGGEADAAKVERGSKTAKGGFQNEDEIRDKFNTWKTDADARAWLEAMNHQMTEISSVSA